MKRSGESLESSREILMTQIRKQCLACSLANIPNKPSKMRACSCFGAGSAKNLSGPEHDRGAQCGRRVVEAEAPPAGGRDDVTGGARFAVSNSGLDRGALEMKFQLKLRNAGLTRSDCEDVAGLTINCESHGWRSKAQGTLADLRAAVQIAAESGSAISQDNLILFARLGTDHSRIGRIEERIRDLADRPNASSPIREVIEQEFGPLASAVSSNANRQGRYQHPSLQSAIARLGGNLDVPCFTPGLNCATGVRC
jgi:hypothetical protein